MITKQEQAEAAQRAMKAEYRRLSLSAAGIQEVLQGGDDSLSVVPLEVCKVLVRIMQRAERTPEESALETWIDKQAWDIAEHRDYSDAYTNEQATRAEAEWEARCDCALLEHQE